MVFNYPTTFWQQEDAIHQIASGSRYGNIPFHVSTTTIVITALFKPYQEVLGTVKHVIIPANSVPMELLLKTAQNAKVFTIEHSPQYQEEETPAPVIPDTST